jgi:hypothetical protein
VIALPGSHVDSTCTPRIHRSIVAGSTMAAHTALAFDRIRIDCCIERVICELRLMDGGHIEGEAFSTVNVAVTGDWNRKGIAAGGDLAGTVGDVTVPVENGVSRKIRHRYPPSLRAARTQSNNGRSDHLCVSNRIT